MTDVDRRPRVLHLTTTGAIAGAEQLLVGLAGAHDREHWNVSFSSLFTPGEMNSRIAAAGGTCYSLGVKTALDVPRATLRLASLIRRLKIDVLHTHLLHPGLVGVAAARVSGRKSLRLVHTRHHSDELHRFGPAYRWKADAYVAHSNHLVCANSKAARDVLIDLEGLAPGVIRVTYPGIDVAALRSRVTDPSGESIRRELGMEEGQLLIGSVAHLLPKKGHTFLLQAMTEVRKKFPNARLVIAGKGRERENLDKLNEQLGLRDRVTFLGYRDDVPNLMNAFDLMVQPSLEEAFGVSMVEAMALGKPIVASNIGGIPEVIDNGVTGVLTPPGDAESLATSIIDLLADDDKRKLLGLAGVERALNLFTIQKHAADYEAVWTEVMDHE